MEKKILTVFFSMKGETYMTGGRIENLEKGKESLEAALDKTKDNPTLYPQLLCQVAAILELTQDYEGAENKYRGKQEVDSQ